MEVDHSNFKNINRSYLKEKDTINKRKNLDIEPRGNFILRQELRNFNPGCSAKCSFFFNFALMIIFISIAIPNFYSMSNTFEFSLDYSYCSTEIKICNKVFYLNQTLKKPVYVYYELENFYNNHREYVKSKSWTQLRAENPSNSSLSKDCQGALYNHEVLNFSINENYFNKTPLNKDDIAIPCGLKAKSFFKDSYLLNNFNSSEEIFINETNIANPNDVKYMYKNTENATEKQWLNMEDEHFIVWMSMMPFNDFRKKWGKIDQDLIPGYYNLTIFNNFDVSKFDGKKKFVLISPSFFGNSDFFSYVLLGAAIIEGIFSIFFLIIYCSQKGNKFNEAQMEWKK